MQTEFYVLKHKGLDLWIKSIDGYTIDQCWVDNIMKARRYTKAGYARSSADHLIYDPTYITPPPSQPTLGQLIHSSGRRLPPGKVIALDVTEVQRITLKVDKIETI